MCLYSSSGSERPESALGSRGVQIMDQRDIRVNPEPVATEEADILLEEYLSPRKLVNDLINSMVIAENIWNHFVLYEYRVSVTPLIDVFLCKFMP